MRADIMSPCASPSSRDDLNVLQAYKLPWFGGVRVIAINQRKKIIHPVKVVE